MRFYYQVERYDGYSRIPKLKKIGAYQLFLKMRSELLTFTALHRSPSFTLSECMESNLGMTGVISSKVGWRRWVAILDCDSEENMLRALTDVSRLGKNYRVIRSSPQKYWVVVDYVDTFSRVIEFIAGIHGCDRNYITFCDRLGAIHIRAFPKAGFRPEVVVHEYSLIITDNRVQRFLMDLQTFWNHPMYTWLIEHENWYFDQFVEQAPVVSESISSPKNEPTCPKFVTLSSRRMRLK